MTKATIECKRRRYSHLQRDRYVVMEKYREEYGPNHVYVNEIEDIEDTFMACLKKHELHPYICGERREHYPVPAKYSLMQTANLHVHVGGVQSERTNIQHEQWGCACN